MRLLDRGVICIDVALDRLAVLESNRREVVRWMDVPLPPGAVRQGDPLDPWQLGQILADIIHRTEMRGRRARIAISDEAAVTRLVRPPRMPRRHLRRAVDYLAEREMPFPPDRARISWDVVATPEGPGVLVAGAWRDVVDRVVAMAGAAGLTAEVIEPRSIALARALGRPSALVLETGFRQVSVTLLQDHHVANLEVAGWPSEPERRNEIARTLVQRAIRSHPVTGNAPLVMAGDPNALPPGQLPINSGTAESFLNGHRPRRPSELPAGRFLAALGLAMRT